MEEWRDIEGYEGLYQVSDLGRVKSLDRYVSHCHGGKRFVKGRFLKNCDNGKGYLCVNLQKESKGKSSKIHQLVAIAFLGHIPSGHNVVVDHIDNNKLNNTLDNLQLITHRHNSSKDRAGYTSKHIGVCWHKQTKKWRATIANNYKRIHLGLFTDELEAAQAYQDALAEIKKEH